MQICDIIAQVPNSKYEEPGAMGTERESSHLD